MRDRCKLSKAVIRLAGCDGLSVGLQDFFIALYMYVCI